jgi:uncharacterized membrane protein YbaN (DUF454 family)
MGRAVFFLLGVILTGVGIAGYFLPLVPGTIFLILAAACFTRSSRRFESWLVNHPRFGGSVRAWRTSGAIPRKAKVLAISMMAVSMAVLLLFSHAPLYVLMLSALFLGGSALFVVTRPGVK